MIADQQMALSENTRLFRAMVARNSATGSLFDNWERPIFEAGPPLPVSQRAIQQIDGLVASAAPGQIADVLGPLEIRSEPADTAQRLSFLRVMGISPEASNLPCTDVRRRSDSQSEYTRVLKRYFGEFVVVERAIGSRNGLDAVYYRFGRTPNRHTAPVPAQVTQLSA